MSYSHFGSRWASEVVEITDDLSRLDRGGFWAIVMTFEGRVTCIRFAQATHPEAIGTPSTAARARQGAAWAPLTGEWTSSLTETAYRREVVAHEVGDHHILGVVLGQHGRHGRGGPLDGTGLDPSRMPDEERLR